MACWLGAKMWEVVIRAISCVRKTQAHVLLEKDTT